MVGNKIIGIILLILGLLIISWGLYSSYNIFKGNQALPQVFRSDEIDFGLDKDGSLSTTSAQDIQKQVEQTISDQLTKIFPPGILFKLMNLISWSIFAWILILGGGKIAGLGIKLMSSA
ncbi:hypothetical protein KJ591_00180 [Patescibacteria group bacterium]|nr:hypothetical protein [Patescibacteria group bacterium]MBU4022775.1 hypothetical protein [Patescibacteria group bacterium]MBU4162131.1 hypothetical protein [Patescibacteria group bacterium]